MPIFGKNTAYINFFIILFISLSSLKYIHNQNKISQLNPKKGQVVISERNLGDKTVNQNQEQDAESYNIFSCNSYLSINDQKCFNNILRFTQKNYQLNSISSNKNGDFLTL